MLRNSLTYLENLYNSRRLTRIGTLNLMIRFQACDSVYDVVRLACYYKSIIPN